MQNCFPGKSRAIAHGFHGVDSPLYPGLILVYSHYCRVAVFVQTPQHLRQRVNTVEKGKRINKKMPSDGRTATAYFTSFQIVSVTLRRGSALDRVFDADVIEVETNQGGAFLDIAQSASSHRLLAGTGWGGGGGARTDTAQKLITLATAVWSTYHTGVVSWD